ncbi:hypothetical protein ACLEBP_12230, partial [Escherichia coli]
EPKADTTLNNGLKDVPSRLLTPIDVNKNNIKDTVVKDGFHKRERAVSVTPRRGAGA